MKTFITLFILVLVFWISFNGAQDSHDHDHEHEECFACKNLNDYDCKGCIDSMCSPVAFNSTEYQCIVPKGVGEECIPSQCKTGTVCSGYSETHNIKGVCIDGYYANLGEYCSKNTDCTGYPGDQSCVDGKCSNLKKDCIGDNNCGSGQVCSNQTCIALLKSGDMCNPSVFNCPYTDFCHLSTKVCTKFYTGKLGEMCGEVKHCDIAENLNCINKTCQKIDTTVCSSDNCLSCSCDGKCMIQSFGLKKKDATNKYLECIQDNSCKLVGNLYSKNSCIKQNCAKEFCAYEQSYDTGIFCGAKVVPACEGVEMSSSTKPIYSVLFTFIMVLLVILF
ncbi:hypothetical protein CYY_001870 [Polysphondylium violaceum]|uniref:Paramecium surface antigen repeat-containing protein n=1 Tax=Polysphondylium violaceum TaxID=133409 RepID=A0A8J4Q2B9_9MYCE|nr:hypothetical protein CYY_001870 [Polysphondylium violaceum]